MTTEESNMATPMTDPPVPYEQHAAEIRRWGEALSRLKSEANDAYAIGRSEEQAHVLAFLREEERRFEAGSEEQRIGVDGRERCRAKASVLRTAVAYIERGDHRMGGPQETEYARGRREATDRLRQRALDLDAKAEKHERECALNGCASAVAPVWRAQANALRAAAVDIESL